MEEIQQFVKGTDAVSMVTAAGCTDPAEATERKEEK